ncbi:MAG: response regulator transcription factor [Nitrospirota bacterium]
MHTVFIVDDHPLVSQALAQLIDQEPDLTARGSAGTIRGALDGIAECRPDCAIIDISLGDSSGLKLIEDLAQHFPFLNILVLSMHEESLYAERCLEAGAKGYIMKKERPEKIITALRRIASGGVYVSDELGAQLLQRFAGKQHAKDRSRLESLSSRELEVFQLIGQGLSPGAIAKQLNLSIKTIETHVGHIRTKMGLKSSRELLLHAVHHSMRNTAL